ncbi:HLA class II histocompatibility antigen, DQ beta 2 chain-like [Dendrobates tinctorius]|uniref:HLA class II histocompatibility antigen, DQ beta 2 chain-like n=1 Tax=Dendrobates tinctorius TaxID=92724 RepID=UPI003CCA4DDD
MSRCFQAHFLNGFTVAREAAASEVLRPQKCIIGWDGPPSDYGTTHFHVTEQLALESEVRELQQKGVLVKVPEVQRVKPKIVVSLLPQHENPHTVHHILQCNVFGFYPSEVEVKWYRNDQEETEQVQSSALFRNGDWTFQILVMLETEFQKGDTFTCEVHHKSLGDPKRVNWHPEISDSAKNKMATGIGGFVLGGIFLIAGIVIYMRGRKVETSLRGPQSEHFIHT